MTEQLRCANCGNGITSDQLDERLGIAKCNLCKAVMPLGSTAPLLKQRLQVPMPQRFAVDEGEAWVTVKWRWFDPARHVFMAFFCVAWDGFLWNWYANATSGAPLIFSLFPVVHVAAGVAITYSTLAGFLNRTVVQVEDRRLSVRHGPLPWPGGRSVEATEIEQLYCAEPGPTGPQGRRGAPTYTLKAVVKGGRQVDVVRGLKAADEALFLEQLLERKLDLKDQPVAGEMRR